MGLSAPRLENRTKALTSTIRAMLRNMGSSRPTEQKTTTLTEVVLRSDYNAMRQMIASGADLNQFDGFKMTPLLWAIMRGDIDAVKILLESGADPNVRPNFDDSPLWSAENDWGFFEISVLLRSCGATK